MGKFSCALVGCGAVATEIYIPLLQDLERAELKAVCDLERARAQQVAAQAGIAAYSNLDEMLSGNLDVVIVLTPPESHVTIAEQAMEAGCHVLIEKPFAYRVSDADRAIEKSRQTSKRFSVIYNERFFPLVNELKKRTEQGEVGKICSVRFFSGRRDQTFVPERWYFKSYGGRLGETLPHGLYQLTNYFDDLKVEYVRARRLGHCIVPNVDQSADVDYDELFVELFSQKSNAVASISYSLNSNQSLAMVVAGTEATLLAYPFSNKLVKWTDTKPGLRDLVNTLPEWGQALRQKLDRRQLSKIERLRQNGHYRQIREFFEQLSTGKTFSVSPQEAREVVRLWEEIVANYTGEQT